MVDARRGRVWSQQGEGLELRPRYRWSVHRRSLFESWADDYDPAADLDFPFGDYERVLDRIAELAAQRRPPRILELGVGTANLTRKIRQRLPAAKIIGIDFSAAMLTRAREAVPDARFVVHDLRELPLPAVARACQVAVAAYVLHEFDDDFKVRLLSALLAETLEPGGVCIVGDVGFADVRSRDEARRALAEKWDPDEHYFAASEFVARASAQGLQIETERIGPHALVLVIEHAAMPPPPDST